ncbi:hypothetical protein PAMP_023628 [Pampus punctatissimus]
MAASTQKDSVTGKTLTRAVIAEMLTKNFERLPENDQGTFLYGPMYLAVNGGLAGLICNSFYRRALNITQMAVTSSLPMAVVPFILTFSLYSAAVSRTLMSGDINCPSCVMLRGALVGVLSGGVYPVILALPVNARIAFSYNTAPMPEKGNVLRHWVDLSRPILRKMGAVLVLQALFGTYLSYRNYETYTKLAQITFSSGGENLEG